MDNKDITKVRENRQTIYKGVRKQLGIVWTQGRYEKTGKQDIKKLGKIKRIQ